MPFWPLNSLLPSTVHPPPPSPPTPTPTATINTLDPSTRNNPSIHPSSPTFTATLAHFTALLRDPTQTPHSIIAAHFTPHEQALLLPLPAPLSESGGGSNMALAKIQAQNRWLYGELLKSDRFAGWAGRAGLAFKFTLVWFGLPVAPMREVGGEMGRRVGMMEGGMVEGVEDGEGEELRFLNGYVGERTFGKDVGVRKPDPVMESYYDRVRRHRRVECSEPVSLRGGAATEEGNADESSSDTSGKEGESSATGFEQLSLRGGAPLRMEHQYTPLDGVRFDPKNKPVNEWVPLYGYQGVVWFQLESLFAFVDAVDRLLCLDNRAGVTYNLYFMDKRKKYATQAEQDEFLGDTENNRLTVSAKGPGDYSNDRVAWKWVLDRFDELKDDEDVLDRVLFVAGPGDAIPWVWEPEPAHRVAKIMLDWANVPGVDRLDVAYLRMPEDTSAVHSISHYGPWLTHVCRILAAGRIPSRPGYPAIPDGWFSIKVRGRKPQELGAYGGLAFPPQFWDAIAAHWEEKGEVGPTLEIRTGPARKPAKRDRWHFFLPGVNRPYEEQYLLHKDVDAVNVVRRRIMTMLQNSMSNRSFSQLQSLAIHFPGTGLLLGSPPDLVISVTDDNLDSAFQPVVDHLARYRDWLKGKTELPPLIKNGLELFPQFLSLRPVFVGYTIRAADQVTEPLAWDPETTTLAQFRDLVGQLWSADGHSHSPAESWITITQGQQTDQKGKAKESDSHESKLGFIVSPKTSDARWQAICNMIVEPDVFISRIEQASLPRFGDYKTVQPFGFRDIYQTPPSLLYQGLDEDNIPTTRRHFDWQLWEQDVAPQLKPVQPWRKQPGPLTTEHLPESFTPKLPSGTKTCSAIGNPDGDRKRVESSPKNLGSQSVSKSLANTHKPQPTKDVKKDQGLREYSFAHPLEVRTHMSVPINAPPVDALLNLGHDSVPVVSLGVLTPTEVRRLQRSYHDMRNLVLSRTERCPYAGCDAVFPANQPSAMQQHLHDKHAAEKCNFCDEPLFQHWGGDGRYQHWLTKHASVLRSLVPRETDEHVTIQSAKHTDAAREGLWNFCARCGRDHKALPAPADRTHHDNVCYPGVQDREDDWYACSSCGGRRFDGDKGSKHALGACGTGIFCRLCGLSLGIFSREYRCRHLALCKAHGRDNAKFCPWCGIELDEHIFDQMKHIEKCKRKPDPDAEGPIDTVNKTYFLPSPDEVTPADKTADAEPARSPKRRKTDKGADAPDTAQNNNNNKSPTKPRLRRVTMTTRRRPLISRTSPAKHSDKDKAWTPPLDASPSPSLSPSPEPPTPPPPPVKRARGRKAKPTPIPTPPIAIAPIPARTTRAAAKRKRLNEGEGAQQQEGKVEVDDDDQGGRQAKKRKQAPKSKAKTKALSDVAVRWGY